MQEGRGEVTDISASPGRQAPANQLRPKEPPPMVIQGDFRKVLTSMTFLLSSNLYTCTKILSFFSWLSYLLGSERD